MRWLRLVRLFVVLSMMAFPAVNVLAATAQDFDWDHMRDIEPETYVIYRAHQSPVIDGRLDDTVWNDALWSGAFVDIEGDRRQRPRFETRMKMLWDDDYLYIGARLEEPHVWGTLTEKNSIIYHDNDFEVFIDPDGSRHNYYELEINPLNTIMELTMNRPYADGGDYELGTNIRGLVSAVYVEGTLNAPHDKDEAWSVEIAIPWSGLQRYTDSMVPPENGDQWRMNFSRVQWQHDVDDNVYIKRPDTREDNWVWSAIGIIDMHRPEKWGIVQFSTLEPGTDSVQPDPTLTIRDALMELYYRQRQYRSDHGRWAETLDELGPVFSALAESTHPPELRVEGDRFTASISTESFDGAMRRVIVNEEGRVWVE